MIARINITEQITWERGRDICQEFIALEKDSNVTQIVLFIQSGGGNTGVIPTLYELVKMSSKPVVAIGTSVVCSTAASIFMMASRRILFPGTEFLLHKSARELKGSYTADELEKHLKEMRKNDENFFKPVLDNSNLTSNVLYRKTKMVDWILSDNEIAKYGITTEPYNTKKVKELLFVE